MCSGRRGLSIVATATKGRAMTGFLKRALGELLSPAMVVAVLALTMSVGGTAYAAHLITSRDIKNNTVASVDIKNGTVGSKDLKNGGVGLNALSPAVKAAISSTWDPSQTLVAGQTITGSVYYVVTAAA